MIYQCEECGGTEILWNSRDGVTPFIIDCKHKDCDGEAKHVNWNSDKFAPNHKPEKGDRVFITMSPDKAANYVRNRNYSYPGVEPPTKLQIIDMMLKAELDAIIDQGPEVYTIGSETYK